MTTRFLRRVVVVGCLGVTAVPAFAQEANEQVLSLFPELAPPHQVLIHPHRGQRDKYLWGTFGPPGILDAALGAGLGQWMNTPVEWGQTERGYAKRFATEYTEAALNASTKYALARLRDEDPSFHPCGCSGFRRRALHALASPFMAYSFKDGRAQFSLARTAGTATSSFVSANTWKPSPPTAGAQVAHLGTDLLSAMAVDFLREFVFHHKPDLSVQPGER